MKTKRVFCAIAALWLLAVSDASELTEFQRGVAEGLKIGFYMGNLSGTGQHSIEAAREFNANIMQYNKWLESVFRNNESLINFFVLYPYEFEEPLIISEPGGFAERRIGDYPAEAFYTATGGGAKLI